MNSGVLFRLLIAVCLLGAVASECLGRSEACDHHRIMCPGDPLCCCPGLVYPNESVQSNTNETVQFQ
ncbi:hypothetical protein DdX_19696 [Ditylenchus destructor]|uniref:Cysteine rich secreted protein n=1 Tax=Ditylenchus destructor TaxID=166010 RepID=A0AAD4MMQ9_9BILA|nr:hypothetical protein DdX_19696 [Ditylenchus destructor]